MDALAPDPLAGVHPTIADFLRPHLHGQALTQPPHLNLFAEVRRARYVAALLKMDWQFEHGDHRAWKAGRDELERLRTERAAIDPDGALWLRHAHENYRHEVRA